jgi:hypothetical protein
MHPSSFENMQKCFDRYLAGSLDGDGRRNVVDIGASDVNGSYRDIFPSERFSYLGCDLAPGPGVDIVIHDPYRLPIADAYAHVVVSGQMLEHCQRFWLSFGEMLRILEPGGYLFLIAPSAGPIHRYPVDCWRFHPDGYRALADYAGCRLIEWWHDDRGPWNDVVGVFRHAGAPVPSAAAIENNMAAARQGLRERLAACGLLAGPPSGGPPEAEETRGALSYLVMLRRLHEALAPQLYLEIGIRHGHSFALAKAAAVGVDPMPELTVPPPAGAQIIAATSDCFFDRGAAQALAGGIDLAFIDGMHRAEFVLRDLMNIEQYARPGALVAIDDVFPNHPLQAERRRRTRAWCGDVWKIAACLERHRPDLLVLPVDAAPAGLLLVAGLDPSQRGLRDHYNPIARQLAEPAVPPADILARTGALAPDDPRIAGLLALLRQFAAAGSEIAAVRQGLASWRRAHGL